MEINLKVNLKIVKRKDMEYIIFQMEINMKANLKIVKKKDMELNIFQMEINLKVNGKIIKKKEFIIIQKKTNMNMNLTISKMMNMKKIYLFKILKMKDILNQKRANIPIIKLYYFLIIYILYL